MVTVIGPYKEIYVVKAPLTTRKLGQNTRMIVDEMQFVSFKV
jgi:hypothetical protein